MGNSNTSNAVQHYNIHSGGSTNISGESNATGSATQDISPTTTAEMNPAMLDYDAQEHMRMYTIIRDEIYKINPDLHYDFETYLQAAEVAVDLEAGDLTEADLTDDKDELEILNASRRTLGVYVRTSLLKGTMTLPASAIQGIGKTITMLVQFTTTSSDLEGSTKFAQAHSQDAQNLLTFWQHVWGQTSASNSSATGLLDPINPTDDGVELPGTDMQNQIDGEPVTRASIYRDVNTAIGQARSMYQIAAQRRFLFGKLAASKLGSSVMAALSDVASGQKKIPALDSLSKLVPNSISDALGSLGKVIPVQEGMKGFIAAAKLSYGIKRKVAKASAVLSAVSASGQHFTSNPPHDDLQSAFSRLPTASQDAFADDVNVKGQHWGYNVTSSSNQSPGMTSLNVIQGVVDSQFPTASQVTMADYHETTERVNTLLKHVNIDTLIATPGSIRISDVHVVNSATMSLSQGFDTQKNTHPYGVGTVSPSNVTSLFSLPFEATHGDGTTGKVKIVSGSLYSYTKMAIFEHYNAVVTIVVDVLNPASIPGIVTMIDNIDYFIPGIATSNPLRFIITFNTGLLSPSVTHTSAPSDFMIGITAPQGQAINFTISDSDAVFTPSIVTPFINAFILDGKASTKPILSSVAYFDPSTIVTKHPFDVNNIWRAFVSDVGEYVEGVKTLILTDPEFLPMFQMILPSLNKYTTPTGTFLTVDDVVSWMVMALNYLPNWLLFSSSSPFLRFEASSRKAVAWRVISTMMSLIQYTKYTETKTTVTKSAIHNLPLFLDHPSDTSISISETVPEVEVDSKLLSASYARSTRNHPDAHRVNTVTMLMIDAGHRIV